MRQIFLCLFLCIFFDGFLFAQDLDSIFKYRELSKDNEFNKKERLKFAQKAIDLSNRLEVDSTLLISQFSLSSVYFQTNDYEKFKKINYENLAFAERIKDSNSIALSNYNLGNYYYIETNSDSAYYFYSKALKYHRLKNNIENQAYLYKQIADIQETEKDFISSENNAVKALKLFDKLPLSEDVLDDKWVLNNLIGIISLKLKRYDKSLEYNSTALEISKEMTNGIYNELFSLNNIAFVFRKQGKLQEAINIYKDLIERRKEYEDYDPTFYPLLLDNLAFTQLESGDKDIKSLKAKFMEAYNISDELEDDITKLAVSIDLTKFYIHQKQNDSALFYGKKSYVLAKQTSSNEILLESMLLLSKLIEGEEGKRYLYEHIRLGDSLLHIERNVQNKYARITLETDELEAENKRFSQQKLWLAALSGLLLLALTLVYVIITQRAKNKELKFVRDQQKANEEIYNLMLSQQDKVDEARANEKKRISQELHDGVLGRLFGTRLSLDSLSFSEGKEAIKSRMQYIGELKTIEEDIRKISHDLNTDFVSGSGFSDILSELIEKQTTAYQLTYDFDYSDDVNWELVANKTKINIYRVIQESMQNIYKHAQANHIKIGISLKNDVICIRVSDDGVGFDTTKNKKGIGLKNINSRISELGGQVEFSSQLGKGTTVDINIPYVT